VIILRRKYKLILIIVISTILAYFIYVFNKEDKINLVSLGDGVASGETSYNIDGISYNDYLNEYFESKKILKNYNKEYSKNDYKINDLLKDIEDNNYDVENKKYIDQIIHQADIITICFGEDELSKLSIKNDLDEYKIKEFLDNYDLVLKKLKSLTKAKVIVIGLYENEHLNKSNVIIINSELSNLVNKYNNIFINISDLMLNGEYFLNKNSYYFSYLGHEIIAEIIIHSL